MPKVTQVFCGRTRNEVQDWQTPNPVRSPNTPTLGPRPEPCSASRTGNTNRVPAWRRLVDSKCKLEAPAGGTKANRSDFRTLLAKDCHQEGNDLIFSSLDLNLRKEVKTAPGFFSRLSAGNKWDFDKSLGPSRTQLPLLSGGLGRGSKGLSLPQAPRVPTPCHDLEAYFANF